MRVVDKLIPFLQTAIEQGGSEIIVGHDRIPVTNDLFAEIPKSNNNNVLVFVDGGNAEFIRGASISAQLVRIASVAYKGREKIKRTVSEFVLAVSAVEKEGDVAFEAKLFDREGNEVIRPVVVDAHDPLLSVKGRRVEPDHVANHVRKLAELTVMKEVIQELSPGDCVIRDGDLFTMGFESALGEVQQLAASNGVFVFGLSKTSRSVTDKGGCAFTLLDKRAPFDSWLFNGGKIGFVKLHPRARYIFRIDTLSSNALPYVTPLLAQNAQDLAFLGYPYGLVEVDKFARVTRHEAAQMRLLTSVKARDLFQKTEASMDAHDLLSSL